MRHSACDDSNCTGMTLAFALLFRPFAGDRAVERDIGAEPLDEGHTLVGVKANLVAEAIAEGPDHQIGLSGVLEGMRFGIAREIADGVARADGMALVAVMKRAVARHHHQDFLLEDMAMAARRPMS